MMNKIKIFLLIPVIGAVVLFSFSSCEKLLETESGDKLYSDDVYRDLNDADAAIRGLYGKLMDIAPQYVVLNELRADLMDVTENADYTLQQLSRHESITADNKWADPQPFFFLINNCNDIIKNFKKMYQENRLKEEEFNQRYSDVVTLRSWLYMQVVIHYGKVPYFTEPIVRIEDMSFTDSIKAPWLGIEEMVDTLLNSVENVPYKSIYTEASLMNRSLQGFSPRLMFINKMYFLGQLHLWNGDYHEAAVIFKDLMNGSSFDYYTYKIGEGDITKFPRDRFNSGYRRWMQNDLNSVTNSWPVMFSSTASSTDFNGEWMWVLYYHYKYEPNPFIDLFSNTVGKYYFKPSQAIIDDWNNQLQFNNYPKDFRGYFPDQWGNTGSYNIVNGQPVINKYILDYNPLYPYDKPGKWYLWRAAGLHLNYSEAANRDNRHRIAYSILNNGLNQNYVVTGNDFTNAIANWPEPAEPYKFDNYSTSAFQTPPGHRGVWIRNTGIRRRVNLQNLPVSAGADSLHILETQILDESGRELAFEGLRWGDLVRIAIRNDSTNILADRIYNKLVKAGYPRAAEVKAKLLNRNNWFLPLK